MMNNEQQKRYAQYYSKQKLFNKLPKLMKSAGKKVLSPALQLYYSAIDQDTPKWAKRTIYGALGYLIFPVDAMPDMIPLVGLTDDLTVLLAALATTAAYIKPEHKAKADAKVSKWLQSPEEENNIIDM